MSELLVSLNRDRDAHQAKLKKLVPASHYQGLGDEKLPRPSNPEYAPTEEELSSFINEFYNPEYFTGYSYEEIRDALVLNPDPDMFKNDAEFSVVGSGTFRIGSRDEHMSKNPLLKSIVTGTVPGVVMSVFWPSKLDKGNASLVESKVIENYRSVSGDNDPNGWPFMFSRKVVGVMLAHGQLTYDLVLPRGVKVDVQTFNFDENSRREQFNAWYEEEMVRQGAYNLQLIAVEVEGVRQLAYAFMPGFLSVPVPDQVTDYYSWINYVKDHPEVLPENRRSEAAMRSYE